jgi:hypothetical protein
LEWCQQHTQPTDPTNKPQLPLSALNVEGKEKGYHAGEVQEVIWLQVIIGNDM